GRRGPSPGDLKGENDWWALGQHHGLATPLLDWTESPYVAAYFAFATDIEAETENRVIFALSRTSIESANRKISQEKSSAKRTNTVDFVRPMSDDNARLINQRGMFTRVPSGATIEEWVTEVFSGDGNGGKLIRIGIPNSEKETALKSLNRMNVNHLSLFPDLYGAARYCNYDLLIQKY